VQREEFERMTAQQVRLNTRSDGTVQRGKPLYFERPWQQTLDEMEDANVRTVGELEPARTERQASLSGIAANSRATKDASTSAARARRPCSSAAAARWLSARPRSRVARTGSPQSAACSAARSWSKAARSCVPAARA
jgi:hypothetical protein